MTDMQTPLDNEPAPESQSSTRRCIGYPTVCRMPPLGRNPGPLDAHALLSAVFLPSPSADPRYKSFRTVLVYRLVKAVRHYTEARQSVLDQIAESERWKTDLSRGQALPILNFSAAFDDCLTDLYSADRTITRMKGLGLADDTLMKFQQCHAGVLRTVSIMRSKSAHIDEEIASDALEDGPTRPFISEDGEFALLGPWEVSLSSMALVIEDLHDAIRMTFPGLAAAPPN